MQEITHPIMYRPTYCPGSENPPGFVHPSHEKPLYHQCAYCRIWFPNSAGYRVIRQHELHFWPGEPVAIMIGSSVDRLGEIQSRLSEIEYAVFIKEWPFTVERIHIDNLKPIRKERDKHISKTRNEK